MTYQITKGLVFDVNDAKWIVNRHMNAIDMPFYVLPYNIDTWKPGNNLYINCPVGQYRKY